MDLKTYLRSLPDNDAREAFAARCSTTLGHMRNCLYVGGKRLSAEVCVLVERHTLTKVSRRDLRPEDWHRIWPELVTDEHPAPAVAEEARDAA